MGIDRLAPEARLGAPFAEEVQAFIAYAETTPNPRWLAWDQPPRDAASEGPPPWHDADGLLIGELVAHRFGFVAWTVDGDGGMVRCFVGDPDGLEEWQATYRVEVLHGTPAARWRADGWVPGMGSMWRP